MTKPLSTNPRPTGINHPGLARRDFLRAVGVGGMAVSGAGLLSACGTEGTQSQETKQAEDVSSKEKVVNFSNWPLYIDTDDSGKHPTLVQFEKKTGIKVDYVEEINGNADFYAKIRPQLSSGQPTGSDIVVFSNDWAARMIEEDFVQEIDTSNIPNAKNLLASLQSPSFDPDRKYTLPWQSGLTGIGTNTKVTGREITSVEELLTAPDLKGKIALLTDMTDTVGLIMLEMGIDPEDFSQGEFDRAMQKITDAVDAGQIRQFTGNDYAPQLAKGNIAACIAWSGDIIQLQFDDPKVTFAIPDAGGMLWSDNMQVPALASHKANAEKLMNYYYDPKVAAEVAAWVNYICPVEGAKEAMRDIDPELADNELIFPSEQTLSKVHGFMLPSWEEREKLVEQFTQTIGL
ncbi:spermidine/putrescine ABC transporter substrate-binding protein [Janibacter cremeus]|uniref:ABC transporter substrate-binding protein n=1 Tax=Janibacter cremeus TaxID=1285192 RepID=UPI0023F93809|nr:spermidine/putrescine ABC transporter substrate-binding protein [Janibacter cremeus]WEV78870.1 spermidine/putrescine ABC transporter substrate-binding protein [Janibacter cremeus]